MNGPCRVVARFTPAPVSEETKARLTRARKNIVETRRLSRHNPNDPARFATHEQRQQVYARDKGRCVYCQRPVSFTGCNIDHLVPWPEGKTILPNLVLACRGCNKAKGTYRLRTP